MEIDVSKRPEIIRSNRYYKIKDDVVGLMVDISESIYENDNTKIKKNWA